MAPLNLFNNRQKLVRLHCYSWVQGSCLILTLQCLFILAIGWHAVETSLVYRAVLAREVVALDV
jgi:hypothetical protein